MKSIKIHPEWETFGEIDGNDAILFLRHLCRRMQTQDALSTSYPLFLVNDRMNGRDKFITACLTQEGADKFIEEQGRKLNQPSVYVASMHDNSEMRQLLSSLLRIESAITEMIASRLDGQITPLLGINDAPLMIRRMDHQRRIEDTLHCETRSAGDCHRVAAFFCDAGIDSTYLGKRIVEGVESDCWQIACGDGVSKNCNAQMMIDELPIDIDMLSKQAESYPSMGVA